MNHLEQVPIRYFAHTGKEEVALHVEMVHRYGSNGSQSPNPVINWRNDLRRSLTIVDIVTKDRSSLFEKITGAFSVASLNILERERLPGKMAWRSMFFTPRTKRAEWSITQKPEIFANLPFNPFSPARAPPRSLFRKKKEDGPKPPVFE